VLTEEPSTDMVNPDMWGQIMCGVVFMIVLIWALWANLSLSVPDRMAAPTEMEHEE
ncbi:hypothetical protein KIPB_012174, partial [Kipferlia bialata]